MQFQDDIRQDIKTFWGISIDKMLKVLVPLGLILAGYILWFPFPEIIGRMGIAIGVFLLVAGCMALDLPRYVGIFKRYRKRLKILADKPGSKRSEQNVTCLQDLIRAEMLHYREDKVLVEWDNGWVSVLCYVQAEPIDFESPKTVALTQKGLKDALAVASANQMRLRWIDDADLEYEETFWKERREQALTAILPGGRDLTLDRMANSETFSKSMAVTNRLFLRIDGSLTHLMRDETGDTDLERKELALASFSYTVNSFIEVMQRAKLNLAPMGEEDLLWVIHRDVAPWTRSKLTLPLGFAEEPIDEDITDDGYDEEVYEENYIDFEIPAIKEVIAEPEILSKPEMTLSILEKPQAPPAVQTISKEDLTPSQGTIAPSSINPFKITPNPFAKITQENSRGLSTQKQKVVPLVKPLRFPENVVLVLGTKRYVGVTTVAVNLTPHDGLLVNLERGEQPAEWPNLFTVSDVSGEQRVSDIAKLAESFDHVTVDLGLVTSDCTDLLNASQTIIYVTDNQPGSLGSSLQQIETLPADKMVLAITKAMPSGLSPGLLSAQLGMPIGIMIPFDHGYGENFGLSLPRKPWDILRQLTMKREVASL
ncbi:hypothetical protein Desaci_1448 [Desulfosporosinus acidiphilus SJ4]|uniref:Uncharacterized protein n=1 Tax=Desulfosporosinus acidiphilus (strain DSM 22704 / JCM 16185 / SJ4) TaxID=646529 RepID=I4D3U1_DESAJ|nr:hypothetical protein [Desulfosporosinus acidiphilus]AFM40465.1 hypothetical protein Desaci_1448 [Desulfosporosinus acidiphilus SJ4]